MNLIIEPFVYPFRGHGVSMLIAGAVLIVLSMVAGLGGIFGLLAGVFFSGYFCATYFSIVESTAVGHKEAPMFPDVSNIMEDLISPLMKMFGVVIISFLPAVIYFFIMQKMDGVYHCLLVLGIIYMPMAALAVIILGYMGAASPLTVLPGIVKAVGSYWIVVVLLLLVYGLEKFLEVILFGNIIIGSIILGFVGMYVLMVSARALGCLYRKKAEQLEWL